MKKRFVVPLILILVTSSFLVVPLPAKTDAKTITVPDDYPTIQAAIGNASAGDTILVKKGTYYETISIDKPLSLIGEDSHNTVIMGFHQAYGESSVITVSAESEIKGFTLEGGDGGISVKQVTSEPQLLLCRISDNIIIRNGYGISAVGNSSLSIFGNDIKNNYITGIQIDSIDSVISENNITENGQRGLSWAAISADSRNLTIRNNNITHNVRGVELVRGPFQIYGNNISDNEEYGIQLGAACANSTIYDNSISRNGIGVDLQNFAIIESNTVGLSNVVYRNDFVDNQQQAFAERIYEFPSGPITWSNGTDVVSWDNGEEGNYWSDYRSRYPNASEVGFSGIGDTPYVIDENNTDRYPLLQPVNFSEGVPPTFQTLLPLIAAGAVVVAAILLLVFKTRKRVPKA